jgi:hypothetical protein
MGPLKLSCAYTFPEQHMAVSRSVYERAYRSLRESQPGAKEEAVMLLEAWRQFEAECASRSPEQCAAGVAAVEKRMPKRIKRKVRRCCAAAWLVELMQVAG